MRTLVASGVVITRPMTIGMKAKPVLIGL